MLKRIFGKIINKVVFKLVVSLKPVIRKIVSEELSFNAHNLRYQMQDIAGKETAQYIMDNVPINLCYPDRYALLEQCCKIIIEDNIENKKEFDILEFGVWRGSTINYMARILPLVQFYGFDSFEGLSEPWIYNNKGAFDNSKELPFVEKNVKLIEGYFADTLPDFSSHYKGDTKLIHIDCDLYSSTVTIFENIESLLKPGLIIVFDEFFNYPGWKEGEFKAWNELVSRTHLKFKYLGYTFQKNNQYKSGQQLAIQLI